jgi:hypothetical protein
MSTPCKTTTGWELWLTATIDGAGTAGTSAAAPGPWSFALPKRPGRPGSPASCPTVAR